MVGRGVGADDQDHLGPFTSRTGLLTAPEPMPSSSAATLEAWHSRVQWSTLLLPNRCAPASGTGRPPRCCPLALPNRPGPGATGLERRSKPPAPQRLVPAHASQTPSPVGGCSPVDAPYLGDAPACGSPGASGGAGWIVEAKAPLTHSRPLAGPSRPVTLTIFRPRTARSSGSRRRRRADRIHVARGRPAAARHASLGMSAPVGQACTHSPQATQCWRPSLVQVERCARGCAAAGQAEHVVDLFLAAGAHATRTGCRRLRLTAMAGWLSSAPGRAAPGAAARVAHAQALRPIAQLAISGCAHTGLRRTGLGGPGASGKSANNSCSTSVWLWRTRAAAALATFIPGSTARQQLARQRAPASSTTQARQLPSGRRPSRWHRCGHLTPRRWAACGIDSPANAGRLPVQAKGQRAEGDACAGYGSSRCSSCGRSKAAHSVSGWARPGPAADGRQP